MTHVTGLADLVQNAVISMATGMVTITIGTVVMDTSFSMAAILEG